MSEDQIKQLLALAKDNPDFLQQIKSVSSPAELATLAANEGLILSVEEITQSQELSDDELETVAGGLITLVGPPKVTCPLTCWCSAECPSNK